MGNLSELTILISGPRQMSLLRAFKEWSEKADLKGITLSRVKLPKRKVTKSICPVDILSVHCPARRKLLKELIEGLQSVMVKQSTLKEKEQDIWLRLPGTYSIPLKSEAKAVVDGFLRLSREAKTEEEHKVHPVEYAKLHVAAYAGEVGVNEFKKSLTEGKSVGEAAERAINSPNLHDQFDEVNCVF